MTKKIRIGVAGYGNLGRGVELAIAQNPDLELFGVFTRRDPASLSLQTPGAQAYKLADAAAYADQIDVMILCGGSATDLPEQTPRRPRRWQSYSTSWIPLTPTPRFRSTLPPWMKPRARAITWR